MERQRKNEKQYIYCEDDAMKLKITASVTADKLVFVTEGRWLSLNFIISQPHWSDSSPIKKIIERKVQEAVLGLNMWFESYRIELSYNSRLDDHNCVMMPKIFTDSIKKSYAKNRNKELIVDKDKNRIVSFKGFMPDDNNKRGLSTHIMTDKTLPHNTYVMTYHKVS